MNPARAGRRFKLVVLPIALLACLPLAACCSEDGDAAKSGDSDQVAVLAGPDGSLEVELPDAEEGGLADSVLDETADDLAAEEEPSGEVRVVDERVVVEVIAEEGSLPSVREQVERLGGSPKGSVPPTLLQVLVPAESLAELERSKDVAYVRVPLRGDIRQDALAPQPGAGEEQYLGEEVAKTNAAAWHAAGQVGAGVKVGIVDDFDGPLWRSAQDRDEVPAPAGVLCRQSGAECDVWDAGVAHGIGVAEIVHEMAPGAKLYLASAQTTADLAAAVSFFAENGVKVISRSLGTEYDGPGDGTGPYADIVDRATSLGMIWMNSIGNSAGRGRPGSYWRGPWRDVDEDGWLEFGYGLERMPFTCRFVLGLRWSDWGADKTDYDLFFFNRDGTLAAGEETGRKDQRRANVPPLEHIFCPGKGDYYAAVQLRHPGNGTADDILEFQVHGALGTEEVPLHVNPNSATQPVSDSASPGMLAVGAVGDDPMGTEIAPYSSEGPTNDGRIKPDISAAACVRSFAYADGCFNGTSAATPAVAGAAALVLGAGLADGPVALRSYLLGAIVNRGDPGPDNVYGAGELRLPAPPPGAGSQLR